MATILSRPQFVKMVIAEGGTFNNDYFCIIEIP